MILCELFGFFEHCSIFEGKPIPYPKREFLTDEDDDKADTGASKVGLKSQGTKSDCSHSVRRQAVRNTI